MYRVIYIKYVSAFDVTPVTGKREREIALSIGKINDEERTGLITGERVSKRKKKKKNNVHRYFAWKQGRKEGRIFRRWYLFASSIYSKRYNGGSHWFN